MKKLISVSIALALVLPVALARAASSESISGKEPPVFHALSRMSSGEHTVSASLTDDQLASIQGESSWSNGIVIKQMTEGGGTNIAIVKQKNGKSAVIKKQINGNKKILKRLRRNRPWLDQPLRYLFSPYIYRLLLIEPRRP